MLSLANLFLKKRKDLSGHGIICDSLYMIGLQLTGVYDMNTHKMCCIRRYVLVQEWCNSRIHKNGRR